MNPKYFYTLATVLLILMSNVLSAQSVGIGTDAPNPNAVLELVSPDNNQGLLVPKMTTAQRIAGAFVSELTTVDNGLLVYDTDESTFYYWDVDQWSNLKAATVDNTAPQTASETTVIAESGIEATDVQSALVELQEEILSASTIGIEANSIGTSELMDGSVTDVKIVSMAFEKVTNVPVGLADGDDDTQLTDAEIAAMGYIKTGGTDDQVASEVTFTPGGDLSSTDVQSALIELDSKVTDAASAAIPDGAVTTVKLSNGAVTNVKITSVDYSKIDNLPADLDIDATDDFDGDFSSLANIPSGLSDGDDDTQLSDAEIGAMGYVKTGGTDDQVASEVSFTPGGDLSSNNVQSALIELDGKVTAAASAAIPDGAVTTVKLSNGAVTNVKITSVDYSKIDNLPANLDTDATDDFDGDFSSLANIPSGLSDGDDDTQLSDAEIGAMGYVKTGGTDDQVASEVTFTPGGDLSSNNVQSALIELDGKVTAAASASIPDGAVTTVKISNGAVTNAKITSVDYSKIDNLPADLDIDATDDFDGDFSSLSNIPSGLSDGDDDTQLTAAEVDAIVADNGYLTSEADGSISNEIQDLSRSGNTLSLSGDASSVDLSVYLDNTDTQLTEPEVDAMVADNGYLTSEADGSTSNEIQDLSRSGNTLSLSGDGSSVDLSVYLDNTDTQLTESEVDAMVADNGYLTSEGDGSTTNEIQNLYRSGNTLGLTGDATTVDLSIYLNTDTNTQLSESEVDNYVSDNGYVQNTVTAFDITSGSESISASSRVLEVSASLSERGIVDIKANPDVIEIMIVNTGAQVIRIYHNVSNIIFADGSNYDLQPYATLHLYYSVKLGVWLQVGN